MPGLSAEMQGDAKINQASLVQMMSRMQEGDLESAIIDRVRNKFQEGLTRTLYHDRVFWLASSYIEPLDYDIRVSNLLNPSQNQQFKAIVAFFNIHGLETLASSTTTKLLLGQHYGQQRMQTVRILEKKNLKSENAI